MGLITWQSSAIRPPLTEECASSSQLSPGGKKKKKEVGEGIGGGVFSTGTFLTTLQKSQITGNRSGYVPRCRHRGGMWICPRWWGRGGIPLRAGMLTLLLLVPPFLLALQFLDVGPRLPRATRLGVEEREGAIAFSVISIEPERNSRQWESSFRRPGLEEEGVEVEDGERREGARAYVDENEMLSLQVNGIAREIKLN